MQNEAPTLVDLAKIPFPVLSAAEQKFLEKTEAGQLADFRTGNKEKDDPAKATAWGAERVLRAEVLN